LIDNLDQLLDSIDNEKLIIPFGRINQISSTNIKATGLEVAIGDIVKV